MNTLRGTKVAILVADGFEQVELVEPRNALEQAGASTYIVSPNERTVEGWNHFDKGDCFDVDVLLSKANADDFDALLLPGGVANPDTLRRLPEAVSFVQRMNALRKPIAAICHGPWLLINAEIVKGRLLTSWSSIKTDLINAGAKWVDKPTVFDGNLLTSRSPQDIPQFNEAMVRLFTSIINKAA
jgi:protease I